MLFRVGFSVAKRSLNGDRDAAEDVVQAAFEKMIRAATNGSQDRPDDPVAYFCKAVANAAKDHLKKMHAKFRGSGVRAVSLSLDGNVTIISAVPDPADLAANVILRERIFAAIEMLTPDHRQVLLLAVDPDAGDFGRSSHAEIASLLHIKISTVKSRLFEAKKKLAAVLRNMESREEGVSA